MTFYYVCIPWIVYWSQIVATGLRLFCSTRPILLVKQRFPRDVALVFNQSENTYACRIYKLSSTVTTYFHWHTLEKHWYLLSRKFLLNFTRKEVETMRSRWKGIEIKIIESIWLNPIHWMNKLEKPKIKIWHRLYILTAYEGMILLTVDWQSFINSLWFSKTRPYENQRWTEIPCDFPKPGLTKIKDERKFWLLPFWFRKGKIPLQLWIQWDALPSIGDI